MTADWIVENIVEMFGAVAGIAYVILEIKRNIWLWPLGIVTSAVYIYVFAGNGFYANMGLQWYYLGISIYGWHIWSRTQNNDSGMAPGEAVVRHNAATHRGSEISDDAVSRSASGIAEPGAPPSAFPPEYVDGVLKDRGTDVRRIDRTTAVWCAVAAAAIWAVLWFLLDRATDSPVPVWDGLIASLSVVATWMLTKKYLEQWYVWIVANAIAVAVYLASGLYPTAVLFFVYFVMAIIGLQTWKKQSAV